MNIIDKVLLLQIPHFLGNKGPKTANPIVTLASIFVIFIIELLLKMQQLEKVLWFLSSKHLNVNSSYLGWHVWPKRLIEHDDVFTSISYLKPAHALDSISFIFPLFQATTQAIQSLYLGIFVKCIGKQKISSILTKWYIKLCKITLSSSNHPNLCKLKSSDENTYRSFWNCDCYSIIIVTPYFSFCRNVKLKDKLDTF